MLCFLDVETLPCSDPDLLADISDEINKKTQQAMDEVKAPSNYKDKEKIEGYISAAKLQLSLEADAKIKEAVHKTGFSGLYGSIACICYAIDDGEVFSVSVDTSVSESSMLANFYGHLTELTSIESHRGMVMSPLTFVGHNLIAFDLPFIKHRSIINRVCPPASVRKAFDAKPWGGEVADTMLMWSADKEKRASMDKLCKAFGIPGKGDFDGSMVAETWPTDPVKVISYCADDVRRTREMYKRLTFDFGQKSLLKAA